MGPSARQAALSRLMVNFDDPAHFAVDPADQPNVLTNHQCFNVHNDRYPYTMVRTSIFHRLRARGLKSLAHCLDYPIRAEAFQTQLFNQAIALIERF